RDLLFDLRPAFGELVALLGPGGDLAAAGFQLAREAGDLAVQRFEPLFEQVEPAAAAGAFGAQALSGAFGGVQLRLRAIEALGEAGLFLFGQTELVRQLAS